MKISHAIEQLSLGTTTIVEHNSCGLQPRSFNYTADVPQLLKPCALELMLCNKRTKKPLQWEGHALQLENSPCSLQLEKSPWSNEDPTLAKIHILFFLKKWKPSNLSLPFSGTLNSVGYVLCCFMLCLVVQSSLTLCYSLECPCQDHLSKVFFR